MGATALTEEEWLTGTDPAPLVKHVEYFEEISQRKFLLIACACCRRIWDHLRDRRSRAAVEVSEAFADGLAGVVEVGAAADRALAACECIRLLGASEVERSAARAPCGLRLNPCLLSVVGHVAEAAAFEGSKEAEHRYLVTVLRDVIGNPFRPVVLAPSLRTPTVVALARAIHAERGFEHLPVLADALEEAGCTDANPPTHCRQPGQHVRGCWVVDLILDKEH
jgi:hypothetical protein